jgi:hypothetical protein
MAINEPRLVRWVSAQGRPLCERLLGMGTLLQDDVADLTALAGAVPDDATPLDVPQTTYLTLTGADVHAYVGLVADLLAAGGDPALESAIYAGRVRPLGSILSGMDSAGAGGTGGGGGGGGLVERVVRERVRPRARQLKGLRLGALHDATRMLPELLDADWADAEEIDDGREGITPMTVGHVRGLLAFATAAVGGAINTAARARAVDAAAGDVSQ